jgi:Xaa-Pro dipeptidase
VFAGKDSDSGVETLHPTLDYLSKYSIDKSVLFPLISNLRAIKTHDEIEIMRYVCRVSSDAHLRVMRHAKPGILQVQLHGLFTFDHTNTSGSEFLAFNSVCSSGRDCATLHYINNDKIIQSGQLILNDMGGRWYGYCADQAITFPVDGKYTEKQLHVYEAVREAQAEVLKTMKEGVEWTEMHLLA